jgi:outer membrane protein
MHNDTPLASPVPAQLPRRCRPRLRTLWFAAAACFALASAPAPAAAQSKIAVVDIRRALLETEEGLRVQATLKRLFDSRQVEISNKERAIQQEKEELEKDAQTGKVSKQVLQTKAETLQKQWAELQALTYDYQREMQRKESELTTPILQKIVGIIRRIAAQEGYEVVVEKSAAPFYRADLEVTDRAIQMYNAGQGGEGGPATPGSKTTKPAPKTAPAPVKPPAPPKKK